MARQDIFLKNYAEKDKINVYFHEIIINEEIDDLTSAVRKLESYKKMIETAIRSSYTLNIYSKEIFDAYNKKNYYEIIENLQELNFYFYNCYNSHYGGEGILITDEEIPNCIYLPKSPEDLLYQIKKLIKKMHKIIYAEEID